jgi:long-chain fatty acid transport protein
MSRDSLVRWLASFALLWAPQYAWGNGFDIYEQSAKAVGMAGAVTAQADDPSAVFFNPAGITQLEGTQISLGMCAVIPTMGFRSTGNPLMGTEAGQRTGIRDHTWIIPNAYVSHKINPRISLAIGSFAHMGLGVEWPKYFEGRFAAGATRAVLKTNSFSVVMAFKPHERLALAFGPYAQYFDIELRNLVFIAPPVPPLTFNTNLAQTVEVEMKAKDWAWGWQLGVLLKATEHITLGAAYLSQARHDITDGRQEARRLSDGLLVQTQGFASSITLPATLRTGLAWKKLPWTWEVGAQWTEWSSYKSLRADFDNGTFLESRKVWHNVWMYRIGVQYTLNRYLDLRAGFLYDESPIPSGTLDPLVPSGDRKAYCGGFGAHFGNVTIDLGYNYIQDQNRRWNNASGDVNVGPVPITRVVGRFEDTYAHVFAVNVTYRLR